LVLLLQIQFGWKKQSGKPSTRIVVAVVAMDSVSERQRERDRDREREGCWSARKPFDWVLKLYIQFGWKFSSLENHVPIC
jgi:hypothetical protein